MSLSLAGRHRSHRRPNSRQSVRSSRLLASVYVYVVRRLDRLKETALENDILCQTVGASFLMSASDLILDQHLISTHGVLALYSL